jgi:A/G-specific adenine glycosylase
MNKIMAKNKKSFLNTSHDILSAKVLNWYLQNKRDLPWRKNKNPYRIWISEVMLQQTTVQAVIPFYERFLEAFPDVHSLAEAPLEKVLPLWAGLGYYSRARNLHKAAQFFSQSGFPKTFSLLQELPGLGPYTARAISSLAFDEPVGVLDGNVIRILCRVYGLKVEWWQQKERNSLQLTADLLAQKNDPATVNQAMMELGATICTPKNPACNICPWQLKCEAFKTDQVLELPLKKGRKSFEIWYWEPSIILRKKEIALQENQGLPFLKKSLLPPGKAKKLKEKPNQFDFLHTITHHKIYVKADLVKFKNATHKIDYHWVNVNQLPEVNPSSLLQKTLNAVGV